MVNNTSEQDFDYYRTREDGFLLCILYEKSKQKAHIFLLDPWKSGIQGLETETGNLQKIKRKLRLEGITFHKSNSREIKSLLKANYLINQTLDIPISKKVSEWIKLLNLEEVEVNGSLYKCFNCEIGNLKEEEVNEILEIAKRDLEANLIGTDKEEQYFYVCSNCKQKLHSAHSKN